MAGRERKFFLDEAEIYAALPIRLASTALILSLHNDLGVGNNSNIARQSISSSISSISSSPSQFCSPEPEPTIRNCRLPVGIGFQE